jgi:hypothetical protein
MQVFPDKQGLTNYAATYLHSLGSLNAQTYRQRYEDLPHYTRKISEITGLPSIKKQYLSAMLLSEEVGQVINKTFTSNYPTMNDLALIGDHVWNTLLNGYFVKGSAPTLIEQLDQQTTLERRKHYGEPYMQLFIELLGIDKMILYPDGKDMRKSGILANVFKAFIAAVHYSLPESSLALCEYLNFIIVAMDAMRARADRINEAFLSAGIAKKFYDDCFASMFKPLT